MTACAVEAIPAKGAKGGECKRTDCAEPDSHWFNPHTNAYYCEYCAYRINRSLHDCNLKLITLEE